MKSAEKRNKFVELRAQGFSYSKICDELAICRQTVVNWSKELEIEINNSKSIHRDAFLQELKLTEEHRLNLLSNTLHKLRCELEKRDLSSIETERLLDLILKFEGVWRQQNISTKFQRKVDGILFATENVFGDRKEEWSA